MRQTFFNGLATLLLLVSGPLALAQSINDQKASLKQQVDQILNQAHTGEASIPQEKAKQAELEQSVQTYDQRMAEITREKREVRLQIAEQKRLAEEFELYYNIEPTDTDQLYEVYQAQQEQLKKFIERYARLVALRDLQASNSLQASLVQITSDSPYVSYEHLAEQKILLASQQKLTELAQKATALPETLAALQTDHESLLEEYHTAADAKKNARWQINLSKAKLVEIQRIMNQVEERVRVMQLEMARIDETLRMQAEQELIAKGLRSGLTTVVSRRPDFVWPIVGRITATFMDAGYQAFFGIPHKAIDIAAPQGSAIQAASDGIVYFVKHAGDTSYSYILIGHRNGYATLYGHMNSVAVSKGDTVSKGQVIGYSGGMPGTIGAGPMTTGPHLHFEFIHNGTHIDPLTMLPSL